MWHALALLISVFTSATDAPTAANVADPPVSCSCSRNVDDYCSSVTDNSTVALVVVLGVDPVESDRYYEAMRVSPLEGLANFSEDDDFTIGGGYGSLCQENLSQFAPGDTLVVSPFDIGEPGDVDYFLPGVCGRYYARVVDGSVEGLPLPDFKRDLSTCLAKTSAVAEEIDASLQLYPNPTSGRLEVDAAGRDVRAYDVYAPTGALVLSESGIRGPRLAIDASDLPKGAYLLRLQTVSGTTARRFLVE